MTTTQEQIAKSQIKGADVKSLGKVTDLILELKNKKVDALVVESTVAQSYADKNSDLTVSSAHFSMETSQKVPLLQLRKIHRNLLKN